MFTSEGAPSATSSGSLPVLRVSKQGKSQLIIKDGVGKSAPPMFQTLLYDVGPVDNV
jgi:hypothetical protein